MILYQTSDILLELTEKYPDLENGFQDAWVAEELIKNIIVNVQGNHKKITCRSFSYLFPAILHSNSWAFVTKELILNPLSPKP